MADAVEKVPKYGAANFALKDKTSGDRHSIGALSSTTEVAGKFTA
jgi:hypothetical protein